MTPIMILNSLLFDFVGISFPSPITSLRSLTGNVNIVVAIDIGTTSSVYAFSISSASDIQLNKAWDTGIRGLCSPKTPTCILLKRKTLEPVNIGYDAQKEYSDHVYDNEADNYLFVDKFKMKLYGAEVIIIFLNQGHNNSLLLFFIFLFNSSITIDDYQYQIHVATSGFLHQNKIYNP